MSLEISNVCKQFDNFVALNDINLSVGEHEFVCLLGPSGCGKTTLLRIIAGLLSLASGKLMFAGQDLSAVPARERGFGIVFQSYSLFPNMTAAENVGYGLKIRGESSARIQARVEALLQLVKMPHLAQRFPWQLSGGQQQRVALARALAVDPKLILLDEPLSALDARVRNEMRVEIRDVQRRLKIPTIMVTHDQEEALMLADRIVCMNNGCIEQVGTPQDLYLRPRTRFVADFVGVSNLLPTTWVRANLPDLMAHRPAGEDAAFEVCVRPENIGIQADGQSDAVIASMTFLGNLSRVQVEWRGHRFTVEASRLAGLQAGSSVRLVLNPEDCSWVRV